MAIINVTAGDFTSLKTSIESTAVEGDRVMVPRGTYTQTSAITINKGIQVWGEGKVEINNAGTTYHGIILDNSSATIDRLWLRNLWIRGTGGSGSFNGIHFAGTTGKKFTYGLFEDLKVTGYEYGVSFIPFDGGAGAGLFNTFRRCYIDAHRLYGMKIMRTTQTVLDQCYFQLCQKAGLWAEGCLCLKVQSPAFEANNQGHGTSIESDSQGLIKLCHSFNLDNLDVELMPTGSNYTRTGLCISNCRGGRVGSINLNQGSLESNSIGVYLFGGAAGIEMGTITYTNIATPLFVDGASEYPTVLASLPSSSLNF